MFDVDIFCQSHPFLQNFDNDSIGEAVLNGLLASSKNTKISWTVVPASQYPDGPGHVAHDILNEKAWVAVVGELYMLSYLTQSLLNLNPSSLWCYRHLEVCSVCC